MTEENTSGAVAQIEETQLDQVSAAGAGAGSGKVSMQDVKGDPSQWGVSVYKKGSFDITE
jgi:hypothetical protein